MYVCFGKKFSQSEAREFLKGARRTGLQPCQFGNQRLERNQRGIQEGHVAEGWTRGGGLEAEPGLGIRCADCNCSKMKFAIWLVSESNALSLKDVSPEHLKAAKRICPCR